MQSNQVSEELKTLKGYEMKFLNNLGAKAFTIVNIFIDWGPKSLFA